MQIIDFPGGTFYGNGMTDPRDSEELLIRRALIGLPVFLVAGFLATVAVVTVMVAYNFNPLNWLE